MKKVLMYISPVVALIIAAGTWYFLREKSDSASVIPQDATAVAKIDLVQVAQELDLSTSEMQDLFKDNALDNSGIDFTQPLYAFVSANGYLGMSATLNSSSRLTDYFTEKGLKISSQRGYKWAESSSFLTVFDSSRALIMGPASVADMGALRNQMAALMDQDAPSGENWEALVQRDGAVKIIAQTCAIPQQYSQILTQYLPKDLNTDDIRLFASVGFQRQSLSLSSEILSNDSHVLQAYESIDQTLMPIEGNLANTMVGNPIAWACAGVDGEKLVELLRTNPTVRTALLALNMCIDADMMLKSILGDVSMSIPAFSLKDTDYLINAQLKKTDFLSNVSDWKRGHSANSGVDFHAFDSQNFHLGHDQYSAYFGVRDNLLYVTTSDKLVSQTSESSSSNPIQSLSEEMKGNRLFVTIDLNKLFKNLAPIALMMGGTPAQYEAVDAFNRLNISATDCRHITFTTTTKQDVTDILKSLLP